MPPPVQADEAWIDVQALAWETRRDVAHAYADHRRGRSPLARLLDADRRLLRLTEVARRHAAEAAGITYISTDQMDMGLAA